MGLLIIPGKREDDIMKEREGMRSGWGGGGEKQDNN